MGFGNAGWQEIWWRFLKARLFLLQQKSEEPEEIVTLKSEFTLFVISLSPLKKAYTEKYLRVCPRTAPEKDGVERPVPP